MMHLLGRLYVYVLYILTHSVRKRNKRRLFMCRSERGVEKAGVYSRRGIRPRQSRFSNRGKEKIKARTFVLLRAELQNLRGADL